MTVTNHCRGNLFNSRSNADRPYYQFEMAGLVVLTVLLLWRMNSAAAYFTLPLTHDIGCYCWWTLTPIYDPLCIEWYCVCGVWDRGPIGGPLLTVLLIYSLDYSDGILLCTCSSYSQAYWQKTLDIVFTYFPVWTSPSFLIVILLLLAELYSPPCSSEWLIRPFYTQTGYSIVCSIIGVWCPPVTLTFYFVWRIPILTPGITLPGPDQWPQPVFYLPPSSGVGLYALETYHCWAIGWLLPVCLLWLWPCVTVIVYSARRWHD